MAALSGVSMAVFLTRIILALMRSLIGEIATHASGKRQENRVAPAGRAKDSQNALYIAQDS